MGVKVEIRVRVRVRVRVRARAHREGDGAVAVAESDGVLLNLFQEPPVEEDTGLMEVPAETEGTGG